jgi:hypothetical protein
MNLWDKTKEFYEEHKVEVHISVGTSALLGLAIFIRGQKITSGDFVVRDDGRTAMFLKKRNGGKVILYGPKENFTIPTVTANRKRQYNG